MALLATLLGGCMSRDATLVTADARGIVTTHGLPIDVRPPENFRLAGPSHRDLQFAGESWSAGTAAWVGNDAFIMVQAERALEDAAAPLSPPPSFDASCGPFVYRLVCVEPTAADVDREADFSFLVANGFFPYPAILARQFLRTSDDGREELALTYGERVQSCPGGEPPADAIEAFDARLRRRVLLTHPDAIACLGIEYH